MAAHILGHHAESGALLDPDSALAQTIAQFRLISAGHMHIYRDRFHDAMVVSQNCC